MRFYNINTEPRDSENQNTPHFWLAPFLNSWISSEMDPGLPAINQFFFIKVKKIFGFLEQETLPPPPPRHWNPYLTSSLFKYFAKLQIKKKKRGGKDGEGACWRQQCLFLCICKLSLATGSWNSQCLSFREQLLPWARKEASVLDFEAILFPYSSGKEGLFQPGTGFQTWSLASLLSTEKYFNSDDCIFTLAACSNFSTSLALEVKKSSAEEHIQNNWPSSLLQIIENIEQCSWKVPWRFLVQQVVSNMGCIPSCI